jgi:hypothetical protein
MATELSRTHFIYIGAAKSGSTWLQKVLESHPEIFVPPGKDTEFFSKHFELGVSWYEKYFPENEKYKAYGELCHRYFADPEAAVRIAKTYPSCKLIAILREPVARTISAYQYDLTTYLDADTSFEEYISNRQVLGHSQYLQNLRPYFENFKPENLLILFHEEILEAPDEALEKIAKHLGVSPKFNVDKMKQKVWMQRRARFSWLSHFAYALAQKLRAKGAHNWVGRLRDNSLVYRLLYQPASGKIEIPQQTKENLRAVYSSSYQDLEKLIGRKVPSAWKDT